LARSKQSDKKTAREKADSKAKTGTAKKKASVTKTKSKKTVATSSKPEDSKAKPKKTAAKSTKPRVTATRRRASKSNKKPIEQYDDPALQFDSKRSEIENIIDSGLGAETVEDAKAALKELKKRQEPYLNWAGKAERTSFEVPTVSLHVHERIDPKTIIEAVKKKNGVGDQRDLFFSQPGENPPLRNAVEFYKHKHNWSNRLIAGDSLEVMNSLIEKEGLAGQVQMIYIDPPYGIKYGSNFQPFVNKRDVKEGKDEDLTQEPEMIKAFRDTWELGIHSYLTYLRDRLLLAYELLDESGSLFIQISEENVHCVRAILDEIFKKENFISEIIYRTRNMTLETKLISGVNDFILWYSKSRAKIKYRKLFQYVSVEGDQHWNMYEQNGKIFEMTKEQIDNHSLLPKGVDPVRLTSLYPIGYDANRDYQVTFEGKKYLPIKGRSWKFSPEGFNKLVDAKRIMPYKGGQLNYILKLSDYPVSPMHSLWHDTAPPSSKMFVVQTSYTPIQRCMIMTTDPGDLVIDLTCGSGTTAYVAEQWGRRWITCDTSRVAITIAKQRLMTALFDYYELSHAEEGVDSGFKYKTVPHITLKSIANDEPPAEETLYDRGASPGGQTAIRDYVGAPR